MEFSRSIQQILAVFLAAEALFPCTRANDLPAAYAVSPQTVLQTNNYSEGIVFDRAGNLFFSQTRPGTVTRISPTGAVSIWAHVPGANGHKILPDGTHLVCAEKAVFVLDVDGKELRCITADA